MTRRKLGVASMALSLILVTSLSALGHARDDGVDGTPRSGPLVAPGTPVDGWQPWQTIELADVRTGETFTLADFYGKTVLVQPMATWCSSCRQQLQSIRDAQATLESEDVIVIAISVETDLSTEDLKHYVEREGFDWPFAVATPELLRALVEEFGRSLANPPATPKFVIHPDGTFSELETGHKSADELVTWLIPETGV